MFHFLVIETEGSENFTVNSSAGSTNLLFFSVKESVANAGEVVARLAEVNKATINIQCYMEDKI